MNTAESRVNNLIDRIHAVFPLSDVPKEDEIVFHSCPECDAIRDLLKDKEWVNVGYDPSAELRSYRTATGLLTPKAFRYYLPVWLLASLRFPEFCDNIPSSIAFDVNRDCHKEDESLAHYNAKMNLFSNEQLEIIHSVLQYHVDRYAVFHYPESIAEAVKSVEAWIKK